ncbi:MAG: LamG domain-containing protein [Polyangiaceae bacterium]
MKRSLRARLAVTLAFGGALGAVACSSPSKGSLVLAVSTNMRTPKDVNIVSVFITTDGAPKFDYLGRVLPDGTVALPSTLAIVEPDSPGAKVRIRVTAFQEANARVMRDVVTTVPHQATALLRLHLSFLDDGSGIGTIPSGLVPEGKGLAVDGDSNFDALSLHSTCDITKGLTSINGQCVSDEVDSSSLPAYSDSDVFGEAGALAPNGSVPGCFDVATCFGAATRVTAIDMTHCTATLPAGIDPKRLDLAIVTPSTGECLAPGQCYVPLDADDSPAVYTVSGNTVTMTPGVCAKLAGAQLYAASGACAPKPVSQPVCEPVTSAQVGDAGPSSSCDGSYVITCAPMGSCSGGLVPLSVLGTSAQIVVPQSGNGGGSTGLPITGTVDPSTCVVTITKAASDASCDPAASITADLRAGTVSGVPCGSGGSDGTCTSVGNLTCTVARGTLDGGTGGSTDAGPLDASVAFDGSGGDGSVAGTANVTGSVSGITLSAMDEASISGLIFPSTGGIGVTSQAAVLGIVISDTPGACSVQLNALAGSDQKAATTQLALAMGVGGSTPIGPGTYGINSGLTSGPDSLNPGQSWVFASLTQTTATCGFSPSTVTGGQPDSQAASGTITISQVTSSSISGSFDLTFNSGTLTGSFDAPTCLGAGTQLQKLFSSNFETLGTTGPDSNGICYGSWGGPLPGGGNDAGDDGGTDATTDSAADADSGGDDASFSDGPPPFDAGVSDALSDDGAACVIVPPGAVSWWRAEGDATDVYGNNPGTWAGAVTYSPGMVGNAFMFGGASYIASAVNGISLSSGTAEGWVQLNTIPTGLADLFGFSSSPPMTDAGVGPINMDVGGFVAHGVGSLWSSDFTLNGQTISGQSYNTGQWAHLAVTWILDPDASSSLDVTVYLDGGLYMASTISLLDAGTPASFLIGGSAFGASYLTGLVDELTIYDNPLSPSQIAAIYAAGTAGKCQCFVNTDCPNAMYTCNTTTHFCQFLG